MKVLVVGGAGYYGGRVVAALAALDGVEVAIGGRRGPVRIDLGDASTFEALAGFEVVVDVADTTRHAPDDAIAATVARGGVWLETSADAPTVDRLLGLPLDGPGAAVIGLGIFPGVSTALAAAVADGGAERVELGVRLSPFSGAGRGNCALMTEMLASPGARVVDGRREGRPAVGEARRLAFESGAHVGVEVWLADLGLIHRATGAAAVSTVLAIRPGWLRHSFRLGAALIARAGPLRRPLLALTEWSLILGRAVLFRRVSSPVELVAVADEHSRRISVEDGQRAMAEGVAAAVVLLRDGRRPPPGVSTAPEAFGAEPLLAAFEGARAAPT